MRREYRYLVAALALWVFSQRAPALAAPDAAQTAKAAATMSGKIQLGESAVELTGPWKFHIGDDMAWAQPGFDDSAWETMDLAAPPGSRGEVPGWTARGMRPLRLRLVPAKG